jgi:cyclopropane-fatty-acyl-phospholipid synthase
MPHTAAHGTVNEVFRALIESYRPRNFAVRLWDGTTYPADRGAPCRFTLVIRSAAALETLLTNPNDLTLGEAYIYNGIDIEGDLEAVGPLCDYFISAAGQLAEAASSPGLFGADFKSTESASRGARLAGALHSKDRDAQAVNYHYDISNDFFRLWLDSRMVYSCAYFTSPQDSLEEAQRRKLDYVCRKLRLRPGERFLDVGCGWGALIFHAARHYHVVAQGITLSEQQARFANQRIRQARLGARCRALVCDYRELEAGQPYDKIASVGMIEHVGAARLDEYFACLWRALRPGGALLNHGIERPAGEPTPQEPNFISRYVFPDGELMPLSTVLRSAALAGFEPRDVESLREHYALTLRHWVRRLEHRRRQAIKLVGEVAYRIWRLFMAISAHGFASGRLNVYQTLLAKPAAGRAGMPLTRADWYTRAAPDSNP